MNDHWLLEVELIYACVA